MTTSSMLPSPEADIHQELVALQTTYPIKPPITSSLRRISIKHIGPTSSPPLPTSCAANTHAQLIIASVFAPTDVTQFQIAYDVTLHCFVVQCLTPSQLLVPYQNLFVTWSSVPCLTRHYTNKLRIPLAVLVQILIATVRDDYMTKYDELRLASSFPTMRSVPQMVSLHCHIPTTITMQGHTRRTMEDATSVHSWPELNLVLLCVCDGHQGGTAARMANESIPILVREKLAVINKSETTPAEADMWRCMAFRRALIEAIAFVETKLMSSREVSGTVITVVAIDIKLAIAHTATVGDCRAVLCRDGTALQLGTEHKAMNPIEHARIVNCGGFVSRGRVLGVLSVARSLGDWDLKRGNAASCVIATPDVESTMLNALTDQFIVVATDGIWDVMSAQQVITFITNELSVADDITITTGLCMRAISLGSHDNCSCAWVRFGCNVIGKQHTPITPLATGARRAALASALHRQASKELTSLGSSNNEVMSDGNKVFARQTSKELTDMATLMSQLLVNAGPSSSSTPASGNASTSEHHRPLSRMNSKELLGL